jgi:hypothetical protein
MKHHEAQRRPETQDDRDKNQGLADLVLDLEKRYRSIEQPERGNLLSVAFGAKMLLTSIVGDQDIPLDVRKAMMNVPFAPEAITRLRNLLNSITLSLRSIALEREATKVEGYIAASFFRSKEIDEATRSVAEKTAAVLRDQGLEFTGEAAQARDQYLKFRKSA